MIFAKKGRKSSSTRLRQFFVQSLSFFSIVAPCSSRKQHLTCLTIDLNPAHFLHLADQWRTPCQYRGRSQPCFISPLAGGTIRHIGNHLRLFDVKSPRRRISRRLLRAFLRNSIYKRQNDHITIEKRYRQTEKETGTETHRDTQRHTETHRDTQRHTETTQRHTETHRDTQRHTETHRDTQRHTETHRDTQRHTETHRDTQRHTLSLTQGDTEGHGKTQKATESHRQTQTDTDRDRQTDSTTFGHWSKKCWAENSQDKYLLVVISKAIIIAQ